MFIDLSRAFLFLLRFASTITDITGADALVKYGAKYAFKQGAKFFRKRILYRGDSRLPQEIIKEGGFDDLIKNVEKAHPESAFVSTSKKKSGAKLLHIIENDCLWPQMMPLSSFK